MADKEYDVKRLPVWAQKKIASLETQVRRAEEREQEYTSEHPGSNVVIVRGCIVDDLTLPPNSQVAFYVQPESKDPRIFRESISVRHDTHDGDELYIHSSWHMLTVYPASGNAIRVRVSNR